MRFGILQWEKTLLAYKLYRWHVHKNSLYFKIDFIRNCRMHQTCDITFYAKKKQTVFVFEPIKNGNSLSSEMNFIDFLLTHTHKCKIIIARKSDAINMFIGISLFSTIWDKLRNPIYDIEFVFISTKCVFFLKGVCFWKL